LLVDDVVADRLTVEDAEDLLYGGPASATLTELAVPPIINGILRRVSAGTSTASSGSAQGLHA
jgi:hypothetical protein